ncbi:MAG: Hsp20/alpha crystallin family protein [Pseudomonadota bacterium]
MSLVKYEPWRHFGQLQNDINRAFSVFGTDAEPANHRAWTPAVDVTEYKDHYSLAVELPGIPPESVEITVDDGVLEIKGERATSKDEEVVYRRSERRAGNFSRRFHLPDTVDAENVKASNQFGVLEINIPKQEKAKSRRIEVAA